MPRPSFEVLVVTPEGVSEDALARVLEEGARVLGPKLAVQARAKAGHGSLGASAELVRVATVTASLARGLGAPCFVNGDAGLAKRLGAHLHVPSSMQREGLRKIVQSAWISCPAHGDDDVRRARDEHLDVVLVSPIYDVPGKGPARGVSSLMSARILGPDLYVVALGGVTEGTARSCFSAGADAVAVMRGPFATRDPRAFFEALENARKGAREDAKP